jgi:hypothetical protein
MKTRRQASPLQCEVAGQRAAAEPARGRPSALFQPAPPERSMHLSARVSRLLLLLPGGAGRGEPHVAGEAAGAPEGVPALAGGVASAAGAGRVHASSPEQKWLRRPASCRQPPQQRIPRRTRLSRRTARPETAGCRGQARGRRLLWQATPGGTLTQRSQAARVRATGQRMPASRKRGPTTTARRTRTASRTNWCNGSGSWAMPWKSRPPSQRLEQTSPHPDEGIFVGAKSSDNSPNRLWEQLLTSSRLSAAGTPSASRPAPPRNCSAPPRRP